MSRCVDDAKNNTPRLDRDRADYLNLLMYRGGRENQWVVYDRGTNTYVPRGTDPEQGGLPEWVPRATTNVLGVCIDGIVSILNQSEPAKLWYPSTDEDADRATAEVAEDADPVLLDEIGYDAIRDEINKLVTLTNGVAVVLFYDNDPKHGVEMIEQLECPGCGIITTPLDLEEAGGTCPPDYDEKSGEIVQEGCGTPGEAFQAVIGSDGVPAGVEFPKGKICAQTVPSFEFSLPSTARVMDAKRLPWVLMHSGMSKEEILGRWPKAKEILEHAGSQKVGGISRAHARAMRQLSSPSRANAGTAASTAKDDHVVYILQHDPIHDEEFNFPDGFHGVMLNDELLEFGPLPFKDDQDRAFKSILLRTFAHAPGSPYGKPPCDDLVPLQTSRNLVDSLIQLILMHDAAPRTFIPLSVTLENQPTGRPGENVYYRSVIPGEKPVTDRGINPPEGLYKYLEIIDAKFQEVSKLNSVLVGARPEGDPTLGEVQRLEENGMRAFKEPLDNLVRFERDLSRMLLAIARQTAWFNRFRQVRGENGQWEISQFSAADLTGKVDVQVDKQSAWPKSPMAQHLRLTNAIELGVLPPPATDPELQQKVLGLLNLNELKPSLDVDRKQIARELDRWKAAHDPMEIEPPDPSRQNLAVHLHFKQQFLKTEEFEALRGANRPLAMAMAGHVMQLQAFIAQAQAAAAAAANPQPPDDRTPAEQGDGSAVEEAIASGAMQPAGAVPAGDPLGDAVSDGALVPAAAAAAAQMPGPSIDELSVAGVLTPAPPEIPGAP